MKCLVVEDDDFGREMVTCMLSEHAEIVDTARDGAEGLQMFIRAHHEGHPYQLICLDIMMPIMDGQEALRRMRHFEKETGIPVSRAAVIIMTTALDSLEDIQNAIWQGECNDYMVKPISQADLVALLNKYKLVAPSEISA
ncbi:MAG TPA: response regulator [Desulfuromonadaceae bacterium]